MEEKLGGVHAGIGTTAAECFDGRSQQGKKRIIHLSLDGYGIVLNLPAAEICPVICYFQKHSHEAKIVVDLSGVAIKGQEKGRSKTNRAAFLIL